MFFKFFKFFPKGIPYEIHHIPKGNPLGKNLKNLKNLKSKGSGNSHPSFPLLEGLFPDSLFFKFFKFFPKGIPYDIHHTPKGNPLGKNLKNLKSKGSSPA